MVRSVVQVKNQLDNSFTNSFTNNFSLFQLEKKTIFKKSRTILFPYSLVPKKLGALITMLAGVFFSEINKRVGLNKGM